MPTEIRPGAPVRFAQRGNAGIATLDRPHVLNALNLEAVELLTRQLTEWAVAPEVVLVVLQGAGERAFCAGGDVRSVCAARDRGEHSVWRAFFRREYQLLWQLAQFPKPVVALLDGVTMGGGLGLAWSATFRVCTEHALLAMPEAGIGLFPDVGASHFLPRLVEPAGAYLALTGLPLGPGDALAVGLADTFVARPQLADLVAELTAQSPSEPPFVPIAGVLARHATSAPTGWWREASQDLARCFGQTSVEAVQAALAATPQPWAQTAAAAMAGHSPTSLRLIWHQLPRGRRQTQEAALRDEFRLVQRLVQRPDFCEGVRANLVDRDHSPHWNPPTLTHVGDSLVADLHRPGKDVEELDLVRPC